MARTSTRGRLLFHSESRSKPVRSSTHKAALDPHAVPFKLQRPVLVLVPHPSQLSPPSTLKLSEPDPDDLRGSVRKLITELLVFTSGTPGARMCWEVTLFRDHVVLRYRVILVGWPPEIPFQDLSKQGAPSAAQMRTLINLMLSGKLYFARATSAQLRIARLDASGISPGPLYREALPLPNLCRRDMGSRKTRYNGEGNICVSRHVRDGPKSAKMIEGAEDAMVETQSQPSGSRLPLPRMRNQFGHLGWYENSGWREIGHHYCNLDLPDGEFSDSDTDPISEFTDDE
ncbi:hypothetical protein C8T65DRAFT_745223 [Cerioporus squamosus]|nr:hypothetical protein C8T65DRAFT_745223 [Cerioporus squamosus]